MPADKHVTYFALQKACEKPGCPLCTIINERIDRYIDGMLFEHISDRTFRAQYRAAGGFCNTHAQTLLSYRDGLAVAILGRDILQDYLADFAKKRIRKHKEVCPACAEKERIEREFLTFIAESTDKLEQAQTEAAALQADSHTSTEETQQNVHVPLSSFFTKSDGLCIQHYALLVQLVRHLPKWLIQFQETRFRTLEERTSRFIDCSAWGRQKDFAALSDADKIVWKELAAALRGQVL